MLGLNMLRQSSQVLEPPTTVVEGAVKVIRGVIIGHCWRAGKGEVLIDYVETVDLAGRAREGGGAGEQDKARVGTGTN